MGDLLFRTKGGAQRQGRPRVFFTCHPADFKLCADRICDDLFAASDCVVYATEVMDEHLPAELGERMNLYVIPVSLRLLTEPNRAMDEDFPFARERHIPVLPILMETGLDSLYSRPDKFGALQYLDPITRNPTAVRYEEKLKKYLDAVLVDAGMAERVRRAFDAYVFLSYRKKDRKQANGLMRLIHADPVCQRLAIWFDEYLTPGESFSDSIRDAMEKSTLFALLVTPSLLEKNELGEPNYVQVTEYPMARDAGMELLPAETEATDRAALARAFPGLPAPLDVETEKGREAFLSRLRTLARGERESDPEHTYLLGLAYLNGIDVEVDRERGLGLVTAAAEAELPEAMEKLSGMYEEGVGAPTDLRKAAEWAERLAEYFLRTLGAESSDTRKAKNDLAAIFIKLGEPEKALAILKGLYALECGATAGETRETLSVKHNLAAAYYKRGMYREALDLFREVYEKRLERFGNKDLDTLKTMNNLGMTYRELGEKETALELLCNAYALYCDVCGNEDPDTLTIQENLALICHDLQRYRQALELMRTVYRLRCGVRGKKHPETLQAQRHLGMICGSAGEYREAYEHTLEAYVLRHELFDENDPDTRDSLQYLAFLRKRLRETGS